MCSVHFSVCRVQFAKRSKQCSVVIVQCVVFNVKCAVCSIQCALSSVLLNISEVLGRWLQSSEQEFEKRKTLFYVDSALRIVKEETLKNERTERIYAQYV